MTWTSPVCPALSAAAACATFTRFTPSSYSEALRFTQQAAALAAATGQAVLMTAQALRGFEVTFVIEDEIEDFEVPQPREWTGPPLDPRALFLL